MAVDGSMTGAEMVVWIEQRLLDAACTLAALPAHGLRPSSKGASWGDTLMELEDLLTLTGSDVIRPVIPSAAAISQMDEALEWVSWITDAGQRRVVLFWMMVHPISRRHLFSWRDIGSRMSVSHVTAKRWHSSGLAVITRKIFGQVNFPLSKCSKMQCF
ncbi:hypothetical protein J2D73_17180 [Acetobacter sacchari]|uniref:DUF6362 domain-containing protein n=2 Tax=Acetobacter sacchari TaxID=2661687 RepID=A0ABS3M035_9PROT|nr:hypothetical protein [Acetobacter sacchari]